MPIYAYRCERCGHAKDVLQRISDPVLTVCPSCGEATFRKQVTAAGFQLKGSGWYVTDFRGDKPAGKAAEGEGSSGKAAAAGTAAKGGDAAAAAPVSSPAPAPAAGGSAEASASPPPAAPGKSG